ncbi:MAG TPA: 2-C-methyl-D-erythritol 2,4-cyclodiphosphate synthase [Opitutae bacterium]|nr:2-C-methyl-D-erythritol 2,4-cyclodiphosphate synthase [Opitutae bacterium]
MQPPFRIGLGYDIHTLAAGRPCILGGAKIDSPVGPEGHSDADVILHAVADAILGASGLPDIGQLFPNTDPALKDMNSARIVERAVQEAAAKGWTVGNLDIVVLAEKPKIAPHVPAIRKNLSALLRVTGDQIGVKATTQEGMDAVGEGRAIACHAVVLLIKA